MIITFMDEKNKEILVVSEQRDKHSKFPSGKTLEVSLFTEEVETIRLPSAPSSERLQVESLKDVIENYLKYYAKGQGHTARAKRYDLGHFLEFLAGPGQESSQVKVSAWTLQSTKDFVDYRLGVGDAPATVSRRLATVKHFGRTLAERVHDFINPAREAKGPTLQASKPSGLNVKEVQLLGQAIRSVYSESKKPSYAANRNSFLLELLLATGLRADEVRLLVMGQLSSDLEWLKNVKTKGRKFRNVYLDSNIRARTKDYLIARDKELQKKYPGASSIPKADLEKFPVLLSSYNASLSDPSSFGLSPKTIWRIIASFGKKAQALSNEDISNLHPHKLRHTFAHGLLESSKDVRLVAQALGHSDVRTTMRYTERGEEEIARAIEEKVSATDKES